MERFSFDLQTVLNLRLQEEEKAMNEVAAKEAEYQRALQGRSHLEKSLITFLQEQRHARASQSALSFRHSVSWRRDIQSSLREKDRELADIHRDICRAQERLNEITQKRKILEKLREKKEYQWKRKYARKEQEFLDELAQNQFRQHRDEASL
ncbi:flagellar export protein FliJ [Chitinivibrio alkaliphilus]|uniref:flagellar export protein FliJ n=1 Tax=Chitinivibrio alkaliphilus TaxID=1505232 RepID=UPI00040FCC51|nr:flagellar FliJ family protein [Chitinivibrio alkaliphilus]